MEYFFPTGAVLLNKTAKEQCWQSFIIQLRESTQPISKHLCLNPVFFKRVVWIRVRVIKSEILADLQSNCN